MANLSLKREYRAGDVTYVDRRRYLWALSPFWATFPLIGIYLAELSSWEIFYWLSPLFFYGLVGALDHVVGSDPNNPPEEIVPLLEADSYYRFITYVMVPVHYLVFLLSAWWIGTQELSWFAFLGLTLSVGLLGGLAINTGHELGHKKTALERRLAKITLAVIGYGHFGIEHNRGHHHDVATPQDSASARFGESIYKFAKREMIGGWRRAWAIETDRLARKGQSPWSLENEIIPPLLLTIGLYAGVLAAFGPIVLPFLILQGVVGWFQLTSANYVEHYGLLRAKAADGRYEPPQPVHSWNSNRVASNLLLLQLQRHSDHHAWPTRRYQALRSYDNLPELPSGYPLMFLAAMIPPLWRKLMDRRLVDLVGGDLTKVNIDPDAAPALMAKYRQAPSAA
jgi:alkane 1-monooxygenase